MTTKAIFPFLMFLFTVTASFSQSMYQHTIDTATLSQCFSVLMQHDSTWRGMTTVLPSDYAGKQFSLTQHVAIPLPGEFGEVQFSPTAGKKVFLYQKGDSVLATVNTTNRTPSGPSLYTTAVLLIHGRVSLISTWTMGFTPFSPSWRLYEWNQTSFKTKTPSKTIIEIKNGLPNDLQHEAIKAIEANINLTLSVPLDTSAEINKRIYSILDKEYANLSGIGVDPDKVRIVKKLDNTESAYLRINGLHKTWTIIQACLWEQPFIMGEKFGFYSNPNFNKERDYFENEIKNPKEKIDILTIF